MLKEDCRIKGIVNLILRDEHGRVKQHKTIRNAVTEYGLAHIIGRLIDSNQDIDEAHVIPRMMSHMAIGTGNGDGGDPYSAHTRDRMLEAEDCVRVQVMRDSSEQTDYSSFNVTFIDGNDSEGSAFDAWASAEPNKIKALSTATNMGDVRVGMSVTMDSQYMTATNVTVLSKSTELGVTTITLSEDLDSFDPSVGVAVTFEYTGVIDSLSGHPLAAPGDTLDGSTDYGNNRGRIGGYYDANDRLAPPFFGDQLDAPDGFTQFGTAVDGCYQGKLSGSSIVKDTGTTPEGYPSNENDYGVVANPLDTTDPANAGQAATARPGTKKSGTRIVYVATFKENNPANSGTTAITEAGIFNRAGQDTAGTFDTARGTGTLVGDRDGGEVYIQKGGYTGADITQTMLCRTTFAVVNKASQDTLQITWSVQLSDQSA